jgi:hypothetical protein
MIEANVSKNYGPSRGVPRASRVSKFRNSPEETI